jgi:hypothetical protein
VQSLASVFGYLIVISNVKTLNANSISCFSQNALALLEYSEISNNFVCNLLITSFQFVNELISGLQFDG